MEEEFKKWLETKVETDAPISSYSNALRELIPIKLESINEKEYNNLFDCKDIIYLKRLLKRLKKNGNLHKFNVDTQNRVPSAAISKYIAFLEEMQNQNDNGAILQKEDSKSEQTHPLNQILYGPPGTGKTFNTINRAIEIIENRVVSNDEDRKSLKQQFAEYKENGQIEFITFHQSYGYEEFVEGIRADLDSDEIRYKLEDGIFKKISINALFDSINFENIKKDLDFEELYTLLLDEIKEYKKISIKSKDDKEIVIKNISDKNNLHCYHKDKIKKYTVGKNRLKKLFENYSSLDSLQEVSNISQAIKQIIGGTNYTIYWSVLNKLLEIKNEIDGEIDGEIENNKELNINYKNKKEILKNAKYTFSDNSKNYILIIDEINRGNISKIFGELITLIEPSKRIGAIEEIKVKLPNSGELFGVPKNLYIIGTMNTADRSIAQIDTALRRRFEFIEMLPKPELLKDKTKNPIIIDGINIQKILEAINERIEYIHDREHTIGHSYFMPLKDEPTKAKLDEIFRVNIIPLLTEYFYSDWQDIRFVLNNDFIKEKSKPKYIQNSNNELNKVYEIAQDFTKEEYQKIYATSSN
jgi:5-methylcytosine-specific restriction protein B